MTKFSITMTRFRRMRGIYARELAIALGYTPPYLSMIEHGKRPLPADFIQRASDLLNLTPEERFELIQASLTLPKIRAASNKLQEYKKEIMALLNELFVKLQAGVAVAGDLFSRIFEILRELSDSVPSGGNQEKIAA